jgi:two-component system sensor histidine kinase PilS (NtrC family)
LLITAMASLLYLADIVWWQPVQLSVAVWLQIAVFVVVFVATGFIASRVRVMGREREVLVREVHRLQLEASDILRNITSGVVTVDGAGNVVYTNRAAERLLGIPGPESVGRPLEQVLGDSAAELLRTIELTRAGSHKTLRAEGTVRREGVSFPIGVTTTRINVGGGEAPSVTAIFTDISDQKRLAELHLRTERLEAVAELSASLAHEIKNPLASIRSSVEQLTPRDDEDEQFLAQLIVRESDRLSRLLTEFLDFSRVQVANRESIDLGAVAAKAADVVRNHPDCPASAVIEVTAEKSVLEGDEDLLHRVAVNLILNAVQATDGEVRVNVEVRETEASDLPPGVLLGHAVLLRVSDNGTGIPQELRERLFEPFVSGRVGGSGLGLAIVQRAVEAHRGVILVESEPGEGTVFSVLLPKSGTTEVAA